MKGHIGLTMTLLLAGAGCQLIGGFEDFKGGSAGSAAGSGGTTGTGGSAGSAAGGTAGSGGATDGGAEAGIDCGSPPGIHGPKMVSQKRGAACFWIDETEVTVGEYGEFAAKTAPYQSGTCQGKPDFNPDASCLSSLGFVPAPGQPVVCVDWCDADAYCTYAGKRLCGGEYAKPGDAANSEWFSACSGNGAQNYPYGKTYVGGTCQDSCQATCETVVAGADTACVSPCGAYDLSGNVAEWVNECNGDISCNVRGGAKTDGQANVTCEAAQQVDKRSVTNAKFRGFRCCGDPS